MLTCTSHGLTALACMLVCAQLTSALQCTEVTCLSCDTEHLVLSCPQGHKVTGWIQAGFRHYSLGNWSYCGHLEDDCLAEEGYILRSILACMWHSNNCQFALDPLVSFPVLPNNCPTGVFLKAKYLLATDFECVPSENIHVLCLSRSRLLLAHNASVPQFVTSVDFPSEYAQYTGGDTRSDLCSIEIRVAHGFGIRIQSVFMDISGPDDEGSCDNREHIKLSHPDSAGDVREHLFCGTMNVSMDWPESGVTVQFVRDKLDPVQAKTKRGFALKYHSYILPETDLQTQPDTQPPTQPNRESTSAKNTDNQFPDAEAVSHSGASVLPPDIVVVVIVMACVILVALVTVVMVVIRRRGQTGEIHISSESVASLDDGHV